MDLFKKFRRTESADVEDTLGEVIRNERQRQGLEYGDVAHKAGVTAEAVQDAERNEGTRQTTKAVLTALDIEFLDETSPPRDDVE